MPKDKVDLINAEREAHERYVRFKDAFSRHPDVIEAARTIWVDAKRALDNCTSI
jgi:hypothetical protein